MTDPSSWLDLVPENILVNGAAVENRRPIWDFVGAGVSVEDDGTKLAFTFAPTGEDLAIAGQAKGDILYRDTDAWVRLAAGTDGKVLTTHGAGAAPTWETPSVDVSVATGTLAIAHGGTGLTSAGGVAYRALVTTDGTSWGAGQIIDDMVYSGANIAGSKIANATGSSTGVVQLAGNLGGTATAPTVTGLTIASEARGDILFRGASAWVRLAAGSAGKVLQTNGAGADPTWVTPSGSVPTGTGFIHVTSGSQDGVAALVTNADVDAAAAIAGSKLANATTGATGVIQLAGDLDGTATSPTVVSITGASGVCAFATACATLQWPSGTTSPTITQAQVGGVTGQTLLIKAQSAFGGAGNGGKLALSSGANGGGGAVDGSVELQIAGTAKLTVAPTLITLALTTNVGTGTFSTSGKINVANNVTALAARNAANTADLGLIGTDGSSQVLIGDGNNNAVLITSFSEIRCRATQFTVKGGSGGNPALTVIDSTGHRFATPIMGYSAAGKGFKFGRKSKALSDANYTLAGAEYECPIVKFTGTLTADRTITVPAEEGYSIIAYNNTTGGFNLVFSAGGTTYSLAAGQHAVLYVDDSNNVVCASSAFAPVVSKLSSDVAVTGQSNLSGTWTDILSLSATGTSLLVHAFVAGYGPSGTTLALRIKVDGSVVATSYQNTQQSGGQPMTGGILFPVTGLSAGSHTVLLQGIGLNADFNIYANSIAGDFATLVATPY